MELKDLREQIDALDTQIQQLFEQRMDIVKDVAAYKKEHQLPVLHTNRETEILERVAKEARPEYVAGERVLFTNIMDISKCSQKQLLQADSPLLYQSLPFCPEKAQKVACQGVPGAYSHIAANKLFCDDVLAFYPHFEDVFTAVLNGQADYGVVPIENSNAGSVVEVYELLKKHSIFIAKRIKIKIDHCLAALPGSKLKQLKEVYSHEQGIQQCSGFIKRTGLQPHVFSNTAAAAEFVAASCQEQGLACICSKQAAERNGLSVVQESIANISENYTRFIVISRAPCHGADNDIVSVSFCLPHTVGSLYRMLTKFSVYNINMQKIESKPIGNKNFDIMFYLDFTGNLTEQNTAVLLEDLAADLIEFRYLGNYSEI